MSVTTMPATATRRRISSSAQSAMMPHIVRAFELADVSDAPFSHLFARDIFPTDVYQQMLTNLPDPKSYQAQDSKVLDDGTPTRSYYQLDRSGLAAMEEPARELWASVVEAVLSDEFKAGVFRQLKTDLSWRFGIKDVEQIECGPRPRLVRDVSGYRIAPHPDTRKKVVTMMIYLPQDESQKDLGTSLYKRKLSLQGITRKCKRFREIKRFPFIPNSGFAFAVNNCLQKKSWHGREMIKRDAGVRNSLVCTFWVPEAINFDRP